MLGTTYQMEGAGGRFTSVVCTRCEAGDPQLARIPHRWRISVLWPVHRIQECHHPDHGKGVGR